MPVCDKIADFEVSFVSCYGVAAQSSPLFCDPKPKTVKRKHGRVPAFNLYNIRPWDLGITIATNHKQAGHIQRSRRKVAIKVLFEVSISTSNMGDQIDFDINEALKHYLSDPLSVPTPEADSELVDCESDPDALTAPLINGVLNPIVDEVANNPESLTRASSFDSLQFLLKCGPTSPRLVANPLQEPDAELFRLSRSTPALPPQSLSKLLDLVVSGLSAEADIIHSEIESEDQDALAHHKQLLEMYGFLLQWAISAVEMKAAEKPATAPARRGGAKGAKSKSAGKDGNWDSTSQIQVAMDIMCKVLKLKLGKIFLTTSGRDTFVTLFTRSIYLILESEARVKTTSVKMFCFKVLCIAVKHHGHAFGSLSASKNSLPQLLTYR